MDCLKGLSKDLEEENKEVEKGFKKIACLQE